MAGMLGDIHVSDGDPVATEHIRTALTAGGFVYDDGATQKRLTHIYATHGYGDHWFGTDLLMRRFRGVVAYATEGTITLMHKQAVDGREQVWDRDFPASTPPCCTCPRSGSWSQATSSTTACTSTCWRPAGVVWRHGSPRSTRSPPYSRALSSPATRTETSATTRPSWVRTRDYLLDAQRLLADKPSPREFYDEMRRRYPDRLNPGPLWYGALGLLG